MGLDENEQLPQPGALIDPALEPALDIQGRDVEFTCWRHLDPGAGLSLGSFGYHIC